MKLTISVTLSVPSLFIYDQDVPSPLDLDFIAERLTAALALHKDLEREYEYVKAIPPSQTGLSRFLIDAAAWTGRPERYSKRCYNLQELADMLPPKIFSALLELDKADVEWTDTEDWSP